MNVCPVLALIATVSAISISVGPRREHTETAECSCGLVSEPQTVDHNQTATDPQAAIAVEDTRTHDPTMAKDGGVYYVYSTGRGIPVNTSTDMKSWRRAGRVFDQSPAWTTDTIPGSRGSFWAPTIAFFGSRWHLYYAVSSFGSNHSAIGLATNATLDPSKPSYQWRDEGVVMQSGATDDWNAIDPHLTLDEKGTPWLAFGSFWGGLKMIAIDPATGKRSTKHGDLIALAARPRGHPIDGAIEAPCIARHDRFYYLFASFDLCCRGVASTYNVRVGRSEKIEGPYTDRQGEPMLKGGGSPVLAAAGRWHGPGHNSIFREDGVDWIVYHAYDGDDFGASKLRISKLSWDADGWPRASVLP